MKAFASVKQTLSYREMVNLGLWPQGLVFTSVSYYFETSQDRETIENA